MTTSDRKPTTAPAPDGPVSKLAAELLGAPEAIDPPEALRRLIDIARRDSGQSRKVADFLLAWWNAEECGGFDLTDLWAVDTAIQRDMLAVIPWIAEVNLYPDSLGYGRDFDALVAQWRPHLLRSST